MAEFPRVLFVTPVAFNPYSGGGATFTSLLQGWPKDSLATIHNDRAPSPSDVCENYFILGPKELDFIFPFNVLRRKNGALHGAVAAQSRTSVSARSHWLNAGREIALGDSIPERAYLTSQLERWIADFRPDVIYTILGSNGMMSLIEQIHARFEVPLVVHIMDDWANANHRRGLFAPIERRHMNRHLKHFFGIATACFGISPAMCKAYSERYSRNFIPFQYALDRKRWGAVHKHHLAVAQPPELLYVGSIFPNAQLYSLIDCAHAVAALNKSGFEMRLRIATSPANGARFCHMLALHPNVIVDTSETDDDQFFQRLADADALLLPVNFDRASVDFIRYSMPTKIPAYLNAGTPILAYGSAETAQMQYADEIGWGLTVTERSMEMLQAAIKRIFTDADLRTSLSRAARAVAKNHDAQTVRSDFQQSLSFAAKRSHMNS